MFLYTVTPCGPSSLPQEHQEGEAGFAIMFPSMDGAHLKPFHFCKKSISPTALKEAGEVTNWEGKLCIGLIFYSIVFCHWHRCVLLWPPPGLLDNPDLRVVLLFVYDAYQSGGGRFLKQILEPLAKSKALIAGGIVEGVFSPPRHWWVSAFHWGQSVVQGRGPNEGICYLCF